MFVRTWWKSLALLALLSTSAQAHFLWIVSQPEGKPTAVEVYFSESAEPDDAALLDKLAGLKAWAMTRNRQNSAESKEIELKLDGEALVGTLPEGTANAPVVTYKNYGVITRGKDPMLLKYYAKAYPSAMPGSWTEVADNELAPLEIIPRVDGGEVVFKVTWEGKPLVGSQVTVEGAGLTEKLQGDTNSDGEFRGKLGGAGLYSVRARKIDETAGAEGDQKYASIRTYATLALPYSPPQVSAVPTQLPELAKGTTSFGAAVTGDMLYVYGGHNGRPHHYSTEGQSGEFSRLNLRDPQSWESLPGGPKLTGLAMVAHDGKLYRLGGFTATNADADKEVLVSQSEFARFDPVKNEWETLTPLPEPRSSFDAAVIGNTLYVVGGWNMQSGQETVWHDTAWSADLSEAQPSWKPLATPPFHRRALSLAAFQGKVYCLGGMQEKGGPTTQTAAYDPAQNSWSEGPALLGGMMDGFGSSCFAVGDTLCATTMSGSIQRLNPAGDKWELIGQMTSPRFFHRQLTWDNNRLVIVGGASMAPGVGKITQLELWSPAEPTAVKSASN